MPLFTPGGYVWSPPWIESNIGNEPDGTSLSGAIFYDFLAGRLGCLMKVKLWGSDDDTTNRFLLRSEVGVDLERVQVPGSAGRTAVKAVFECVASRADTNADDEYGTSEIDVSWSSRPYVVVDDGRRGDLVYSDNDNENLMRAKQSAGDSPITPLLGVFGYDIPQRMPGVLVTFSVELDRPAPQQIRRIFVGVEDVVSASSNDVSYEVSIDSHWLLKQIDVIYF